MSAGVDRPAPFRRTFIVAASALAVSAVLTVLVSLVVAPRLPGGPGLAGFLIIKLFTSTFNVLVLLALTGAYVSLYRDLPNRFTLSLVVFTVALLFYALSSNPILFLLIGFTRVGVGLSVLTFLPDLFASVAIVVLLYQSYQ